MALSSFEFFIKKENWEPKCVADEKFIHIGLLVIAAQILQFDHAQS
jgi:hypothetical protein